MQTHVLELCSLSEVRILLAGEDCLRIARSLLRRGATGAYSQRNTAGFLCKHRPYTELCT